jgi:hypothetical protein
MISISENPFRVHTPEALSAEEVVRLYVSEMPGADTVHSSGHTMIFGARLPSADRGSEARPKFL